MSYLNQGSKYLVSLASVIFRAADLNYTRNIKEKSILDKYHESVMEWENENA